MKIQHFYNEKQLKYNKIGLLNLIYECDFIYNKQISALINEIDDKSLLCALDEFGEPCGFMSIEDTGKDLYIDKFYVGMSERKKGYGKALLDYAIKLSKKLGYDSVSLSVAKDNVSAIRYYIKNKFIIDNDYSSSLPIHMKRYNLSSIYSIAGILYELAKNTEPNNLRNALENVQDKEIFYKYFSTKDEERLDKILMSKSIRLAIDMLEGREVSEEEKYYKKAQLCVECFNELKQQDKYNEKWNRKAEEITKN